MTLLLKKGISINLEALPFINENAPLGNFNALTTMVTPLKGRGLAKSY
jgi:hypothetical protein